MYQAGTLAGNPLAMRAGVITLEKLQMSSAYELLEERSSQLEGELRSAFNDFEMELTLNRVGSLFCGFFTGDRVSDLSSARRSDTDRYSKYFHGMLREGVNLAPAQFEAGFVAFAHTEEDVALTGAAARRVLRALS